VMDVQGAGFTVDAQTGENFQKTDLEPREGFSDASFGVGNDFVVGKGKEGRK